MSVWLWLGSSPPGYAPPVSRSWSPATKRTVVVALVLIGFLILYLGRSIFTPFVLALLLALVLSPAIDFFRSRLRFRHGAAVAVSYLLFVAVIVIVPVLLVPALVESAAAIDVVAIVDSATERAIETLESFRTVEIFGSELDLSSSIDPLLENLRREGQGFDFDLAAIFGEAWNITSAVFASVLGIFTTALLSLVMSVYLAGSVDRGARAWMYSLVPDAYNEEIRILGARIARVWTGYLRGQLTVAVVIGILTALTMFALGLPGALVVGVIGGFLNIVPTFGPIFASVIAAAVALAQGSYRFDVSNWVFALIVVGAYTVIQQLESSVITPRILGGAVAVSPLAILLGILVGFSAAGILGAIVAVPVVATGRELLMYVQAKLKDEAPFPDGVPPPRPTLRSRLENLRQRTDESSGETGDDDSGTGHPDGGTIEETGTAEG